jgi:dihydrodipicolinate synthase/N-acetylneuraminate lyase
VPNVLPATAAQFLRAASRHRITGLFVADLISLIRWDANHGNPELFKAVHQIQHHYAKPFSQQLIEHDERIRQEERERVLDLLITFRKAQSRVYPLKVSWEEEGKYILELRGGEP